MAFEYKVLPSVQTPNEFAIDLSFKRLSTLLVSSPTFVGLTLTGLTASRLVATDGSKALASVADLTSWIAGGTGITVSNDGDGTVTISTSGGVITGALTSGKIPKATGATTLTDSLLSESGNIVSQVVSAAGATVEFLVQNSNNASGTANTQLRLKNGGSAGGDQSFILESGNAGSIVRWVIGSDRSDSDKLKFMASGSGLGGSDLLGSVGSSLTIETGPTGKVGIHTDSPVSDLEIHGSTTAGVSTSLTSGSTSSGSAKLEIIANAAAGDPFISYIGRNGSVSGGTQWVHGVDNSVSGDPFVLSAGVTLGSGDVLSITTTGDITTVGSFTLADAKNIIVGSTTGTKIGTATSQKIGLWNVTPVIQPASANQAAVAAQTQDTLTDSTTGTANTTLVDVGAAFSQSTLNDNFADIAAQLAKIKTDIANIKTLQDQTRTDLVAVGIQKGSA